MDSSDDFPRVATAATPLIGSIYHRTWTYIAFIWLGLGTTLPFNFFITADPYFRYKLHDPSINTSMTSLEFYYENSVTICASLTNLLTVILVTYVYVPYIHKTRIYTSLSGITLCLSVCCVLTVINVKEWRAIFFAVTMLLVMIQSICSAVLLNCLFSSAATLPSRYIQGLVSGQAIGGIFVVICSIISIVVSSNISTAALIYFLLAILVLISNIIIYFFLEKSHLFQIYSSAVREINNEYEAFFHESSSYDDGSHPTMSITSLAIRQRLYVAYKHVKWNFFGVFFTFISTLSLFPGYLSKIQPAYPSTEYPNSLWAKRLYAQVMTFLLFYIGDTFGRMISLKFQKPSLRYPRVLFFICLSRFLFIIFFGFCHFPNANGFPYLFKHDAIYTTIMLIFSISHGYCHSLNMMYAPRRVHSQLTSTVGALMTMALASGTFIGSVLSFGVVTMYGDSTPMMREYLQ
ncbi:unnamed protein product [Adineta ricciae]|uniref:Uncharacterized protein n=1 Tax=Adineta ricciae TaxID=249248 RepID=A0A814BFA4_ADIRI|nr:unnamed protein product [Adineta ricciae]